MTAQNISAATAAATHKSANLVNRPMLLCDLATLDVDEHARAIREMVRSYRREKLPVMNGSFTYSNFVEGPSQALTCNPYRLWEYTSLLTLINGRRDFVTFLDIGGAGSALPYFLAETGHRGVSVELQPLLVTLCNQVAHRRGLDLRGEVADLTASTSTRLGLFDLITMVSVLEHIQVSTWPRLFTNIVQHLRPGGVLYLTFDYGCYEEDTDYRSDRSQCERSASINDITAVCSLMCQSGLVWLGNDPRDLPNRILMEKRAPGRSEVAWRYASTVGPFDRETPWSDVLKYVVNRVVGAKRPRRSRFDYHNFFRLAAVRPECVARA